ncbi:hypothetical protein RQP53_01605 [Paucibacter sp. APW11]|uniref:DUF2497 domain-containing protein n=1 Tax=Roseateles aquae TaxID=3077235 RepID=A0ABU3P6W5_9BURK|nr:hypothetical protein [Paucibacter sp. APW11]MDT8997965.1 hypothetical protein [Paucibacter sp. APW11]
MSQETRPDLLPEGWAARRRSSAAEAAQIERLVPVLTEVLDIEALVVASPSPEVQHEVQVADASDRSASGLHLSAELGGSAGEAELLETPGHEANESFALPAERAGLDASIPDGQPSSSAPALAFESPQRGSEASFAEHLDELLSGLDLAGSPLPAASRPQDATDTLQAGAGTERGDQFLAALDGLHGEIVAAAPDAPLIELDLGLGADTEGQLTESEQAASMASPEPALALQGVVDGVEPHASAAAAFDAALLDRLVTQALVPALEETLVRLTPLIADELRTSLRSQFARLLAEPRAKPQD